MPQNGFVFAGNAVFLQELLQKYLQDKSSVDPSWHKILDDYAADTSLKDAEIINFSTRAKVIGVKEEAPAGSDAKKKSAVATPANAPSDQALLERLQTASAELVRDAYIRYAHLASHLNPLAVRDPLYSAAGDKSTVVSNDLIKNKVNFLDNLPIKVAMGGQEKSFKNKADYYAYLDTTFCHTVGYEFEYITSHEEREWVERAIIEESDVRIDQREQKKLLNNLVRADSFEQFIHTKFPGAKRFSIEGGDNAINAMEVMIETLSKAGGKHYIVGMAHRGRLNILTHVIGKPYHAILSEFMGRLAIPEGTPGAGDVKYHMGYNRYRKIDGVDEKIYISLNPNPSHLEAVNPVVIGKVRAEQDEIAPTESIDPKDAVVPILIHGDAAAIGQGIVAECYSMANLKGYTVGGTMHIIINNQIGFTTDPSDSRSSTYSSDFAKSIEAPVFHVNGDDAEAVYRVSKIAAEYRTKFKKDVVIDLMCYRRYGHNEGDEPMFTQPLLYKNIKQKDTPAKVYAAKLLKNNEVDQAFVDHCYTEVKDILANEFTVAQNYKSERADWFGKKWDGFTYTFDKKIPVTGVDIAKLKEAGEAITNVTDGFVPNSKIANLLKERKGIFKSGEGLDWACGELLAYATLLQEGYPVRLSGEDVERGTFSHRHSVINSDADGKKLNLLNQVPNRKADFQAFNSLLSEFAVLGFEYGYSVAKPNGLTIWEAQFGDFSNGAVVILDQFISSAESKWLRLSGLVMLLPHGMEGQGPEHSSARLERYLQACAEDNMIVANCTTPANLFHILRRQLHSQTRKPLIIMSPKSLLRHKLVKSSLSEFGPNTHFQPIIGEHSNNVKGKLRKLVITSGKLYYDLLERREADKMDDVAILRVEQYYPFHSKLLEQEISRYKSIDQVVWAQEESKNMGAYNFIRDYLQEGINNSSNVKNKVLNYVGRVAAASPATGSQYTHQKEQAALVEKVLL